MQWPDGRSKHIRQWLGCGNSIPRYVFPISKTCVGPYRRAEDLSRYEEGLRRAGLPE